MGRWYMRAGAGAIGNLHTVDNLLLEIYPLFFVRTKIRKYPLTGVAKSIGKSCQKIRIHYLQQCQPHPFTKVDKQIFHLHHLSIYSSTLPLGFPQKSTPTTTTTTTQRCPSSLRWHFGHLHHHSIWNSPGQTSLAPCHPLNENKHHSIPFQEVFRI